MGGRTVGENQAARVGGVGASSRAPDFRRTLAKARDSWHYPISSKDKSLKAMKSPKLSKIAKSPLTYIALAVAIAAFVVWLFASERMNGLAASGPREVVIEVPVTYRNPDGTWPSPVPTAIPLSGQSDDYDPIMEPDAIGIATMGKFLYLFGGGGIQLPANVYVKDFFLLPEPCSGSNCPEHPVAVLARGDDWVAIDRHGDPIPGWSNSPAYKPDRFKFLED